LSYIYIVHLHLIFFYLFPVLLLMRHFSCVVGSNAHQSTPEPAGSSYFSY